MPGSGKAKQKKMASKKQHKECLAIKRKKKAKRKALKEMTMSWYSKLLTHNIKSDGTIWKDGNKVGFIINGAVAQWQRQET